MSVVPARRAAVAGQFYPLEPQHLREAVEHYLDDSGVEPAEGGVAALVCPHAGYIYSGPTAGFAYARVRGHKVRRVVLLGCSHRYAISSASVYTRGGFETPLGTFPIDHELADAIANAIGAPSSEPHLFEHSLEVQLPFVSVALGVVPIVPVLFGAPAREWHGHAGRILAEVMRKDDLLIVSTDLSHYMAEAEARSVDRRALDGMLAGDWHACLAAVEQDRFSMCGASAVVAAMAFATARGDLAWRLLDYRTSAEASGDFTRVVGYAALVAEGAA